MQGKSLAVLLACLVIAAVSTLHGLSTAGQDEHHCAWRTYELVEADSADVAILKITGTGSYCGDSIEITVTPTVDFGLRIRVEPGTVLHSTVAGEQDMVVRRVRGKRVSEWRIEPSVDIEVECGETETYILEAYCLDRDKRAPSSTTEFTIGKRATGEVAEVIAVLPDHEEASVDAVQTAVWVATEDIPVSDVTSGDSLDHRQATEILTSADLDSEAETLDGLLLLACGIAMLLLLVVLDTLLPL